MRTISKQASKVKYSSLQRIWKGQARLFGLMTITRTFDNFDDACAWYDQYQEGWRYNNAVAVVWQGVTSRTPKQFYHDAMLGGKEWALAKERGITSQAQCDYLLNSKDLRLAMALRTKYPTISLVRLEYSDNDYTYISSAYSRRMWRASARL